MSTGPIVVLNAGSSSLKFAVFQSNSALSRGQIEPLGDSHVAGTRCRIRGDNGASLFDAPIEAKSHANAMEWLLEWLRSFLGGTTPAAFAHRVVHGGDVFTAPVRVDADILIRLEQLVPLAPLHQPHNLAPIRYLLDREPATIQVASFDTAFHATQDRLERIFPLPRPYFDRGIKRYGFHGHSFQSIASQLPSIDPVAAQGRTVVFHLGNGSSACALRAGKSAATTMGLSTLDGLMMGTRTGSIDPGLVLHLLQQDRMTVADVSDLLYKQSGLLGVSGVSSDMRELLASSEPAADLAVDLFCHVASKSLATLAAVLEGLDAVVFTGGIGENAPSIRETICKRSAWLGVDIDSSANAANSTAIHAEDGRVKVLVVKTDEESVIAASAERVIGANGAQ